MTPPDDGQRSLSGLFLRVLLTLFALCALYALSFGPVAVVCYRWNIPPYYYVSDFYEPLVFMAERTGTNAVLARYNTWWITLCRPEHGYLYNPFHDY